MKLEVISIKKKIDKKNILKDVSFECSVGEKIAILGPNGAGKTTTFMVLSGFYKADEGKINLIDDSSKRDITHLSAFEKAKLGIAYLPQKNTLFEDISVYENFKIAAQIAGISVDRIDEVVGKFGIQELMKKRVSVLSGGERRKVEIARVWLLSPNFLILDEPFAGIDPKSINLVASIIDDLSKNVGVIISDHNVRDVLKICNRVYLLYDGRTIEEGTPDQIIKSYKAKTLFFGESFEL